MGKSKQEAYGDSLPIQGTAPYMGKGTKLQAMHQGKIKLTIS